MMNREDRAKQFLPFDTLKGLRAELQRREEIHSRVEKPILSDTQQAEISDRLKSLSFGDTIRITYYAGGHILAQEDVFVKIDLPLEKLYLKTLLLPLPALLSVEKIDRNDTI